MRFICVFCAFFFSETIYGQETGSNVQVATSPELLLENLLTAMNDRDLELYGTLLHEDFQFAAACVGEESRDNQREEELSMMENVFQHFAFIEVTLTLTDTQTAEAGQNLEIRMQMLLIDENGDGFRSDQLVTLSAIEDGEGIWRISRWLEHAPGGTDECQSRAEWSFVKRAFGTTDTSIDIKSFGVIKKAAGNVNLFAP